MSLRETALGIVTKRFPSLMYYVARNRNGVRVHTTPGWIDIACGNHAIRLSRKHAIYIASIIDEFEFYYGAASPIEIDGVSVVDFSTPRFHEITGFPDFPIFCPSFAEPLATVDQYLGFANLSEGQVALDLGSYTALTSIAFSKAIGSQGTVIALEPDPISYAASRKNIAAHSRINRLDNIVLLNKAVASKRGTMEFVSEGALGASAHVGGYRGDVIHVETLSLDDIACENHLERVDFVKMDIEGGEIDALRCEPFFSKFRPRIIIEPHIVDGALSSARVRAMMESYGYRCEEIPQIGGSVPLITAVRIS